MDKSIQIDRHRIYSCLERVMLGMAEELFVWLVRASLGKQGRRIFWLQSIRYLVLLLHPDTI